MKLVIKFSFFFILLFFLSTVSSATNKIVDPIKKRQIVMLKIQKTIQSTYKQIVLIKNTDNLSEYADTIKINAKNFTELFPNNSRGGEASSEVWNNSELFLEYQEQFISDINIFRESIISNDLEIIQYSFNQMTKNCGGCHRKFKD